MATLAEFQDYLEDQAATLLALENREAAAVRVRAREAVARFRQDLMTQWVIIVGDLDLEPTPLDTARLIEWIRTALEVLAAAMAEISAEPAAVAGVGAGIGLAVGFAILAGEDRDGIRRPSWPPAPTPVAPGQPVPPVPLPTSVRARVNATAEATARQVARARVELTAAPLTVQRRTEVLAVATRAATILETGVRDTVNGGGAGGAVLVGTANDWDEIWRPERDACLHCLAYAGRVSQRGRFPSRLTYGTKPLTWAKDPLTGPPLHPHCRCSTTVWSDRWRSGPTSLPEALAREAQRSVVKGWALPTESERARRAAAERLLNSGVNLPRTVVARARASVRSSRRFTKPVPTFTP